MNKTIITLLPLLCILSGQPIIGIFNQGAELLTPYSHWIEDAGGHPISIDANAGIAQLVEIFKQIDGLVIPGGHFKVFDKQKILTPFVETLRQALINYTKPLFVIGGGMNAYFALIDHQYPTPVSEFFRYYKAENYAAPLNFNFNHESRMWSGSSNSTLEEVAQNSHVYFDYNQSVSFQTFLYNDYLRNNFQITSQSSDQLGQVLIASIQHNTKPIYGTLFHPQSASYQDDPARHIPHDSIAQIFNNNLAKFFVQEANRNIQQ